MPVFYEGLDRDIAHELICSLKRLWVNDVKPSEERTELDSLCFFRPAGLTVCQKSFEVRRKLTGYRRGMDLVIDMVRRPDDVRIEDLFHLHQTLMLSGDADADADEPAGVWKTAPNGTYVSDGERQVYYEYAAPEDVPCLMDQWLMLMNDFLHTSRTLEKASEVYARLHLALVWIHPFSDGNGRMARLIANLPALKAGFPPIVISGERRKEYIRLLSQYKLAEGSPETNACLLPSNVQLERFIRFCRESWETSMTLVCQAHEKQKMRRQGHLKTDAASSLHEHISI